MKIHRVGKTHLFALLLATLPAGMSNVMAQDVSTPFTIPVQGAIRCIALQPDGAILVAGSFQSIGNLQRTNIARLHADGTPDPTFDAGPLFEAGNLLVQEDGKILLSELGGDQLVRLQPQGNRDPSFKSAIDASGAIFAMNMDLNGRILLAGTFLARPVPWAAAGLVRLLPDGSLDPALITAVQPFLSDVAVGPEGDILAIASFEVFRYTQDGQLRPLRIHPVRRYYRLLTQGMLADTFGPVPDSFVSFAPQANGQVMAVGQFSVPATLGFVHEGLHRLKADGTPDRAPFLPEYDQIFDAAVALQPDGNIILAGRVSVQGTNATLVKRVQNPQPGVRTLVFSDQGISWTCAEGSPAFSQTIFERSTNGVDWAFLGRGKRLNGTWILDTAASPGDFVRVRGLVTTMNLWMYSLASMYWQEDQAVVGAPAILQQPQSRTSAVGSTVEFGVSVAAMTPISYSWYKDGLPIPTATNATFLFSPVKQSDAGRYSVLVSNLQGKVFSQASELALTLSAQLKSELLGYTAGLGSNVVFHADAAGAEPIAYQWKKDGTNIPAATNSTLLIEGATPGDAGKYRVLMSNAYGTELSPSARLLVAPPLQIWFSNGQVKINWGTFARVVVEASKDLRNWTPVQTNVIGVGSSVTGTWLDVREVTEPIYFYRARAD